jgi:UDP-N-acetylglucosamine--N-acetylmuramyl-(pentapeptide) pyrophosphoryl-undecaprenol N-acetylglucosamine transferase
VTVRLLIAAGGTGGHFYPGLAVLDALRARAEIEPMFVGTPRGIEARVVPTLGYPVTLLDVSPLNGVRGAALARALGKLPGAALGCVRTLARFRPHAVLSVGGYASGPITALAVAARVPTAVVEPNAVPGLTNRLLGRFVDRAYLTYDETAGYFRSSAARVVGTPVRRAFLERARAASDTRGEQPHVLVTGGSQGARALNQALPGAVAAARGLGVAFTVTHQTGPAERDAVARAYAERGQQAEVVAYIDDVAAAMARADLVVCRAGAGTVAELCVLGRPALFIPLPTAADDHQRKNAEAVAARGAGECLAQQDLTEAVLAARLEALLGSRATLRAMEERARQLGRPDAADRVAEDLLARLAAR